MTVPPPCREGWGGSLKLIICLSHNVSKKNNSLS